MSFNLQSSMYK